jgi:hypothetical protein
MMTGGQITMVVEIIAVVENTGAADEVADRMVETGEGTTAAGGTKGEVCV